MHAIIRIDEVEKEGIGKISAVASEGKVANFPLPGGAKPVNGGDAIK
jgi:hypothetical protein